VLSLQSYKAKLPRWRNLVFASVSKTDGQMAVGVQVPLSAQGETDEMKTFNEWSALGYKIIKGSKATWVDGVAKFSTSQVTRYMPTKKTKIVGRDPFEGLDHDEISTFTGMDYLE